GYLYTTRNQRNEIITRRKWASSPDPSNQSMTSSVAEIKTDLHQLLQSAVIDIKFSPKNPYLVQQQSVDSHEWTQVIDNDPYKENDTTIEVDNNTPLKQLIDNYQKYAHNNPYALNENNEEGVKELDKHTRSKREREKKDQMEMASNIMINRKDATGETETKKMSYSEAKTVGIDTKKKIPDIIDLIQEQITQTVGSGNEVILSITDYKKVNEMIKILKETFEFNNIPTHLLQLPELERPN
ncbi:12027_t:CDS:2, partial [Gigaspora margarita]